MTMTGSPQPLTDPNLPTPSAAQIQNFAAQFMQQHHMHDAAVPGAYKLPVGTSTNGSLANNAVSLADYFNQLMRDKKYLQMMPNLFLHVERLLEDEINKVKTLLCSASDRKNLDLPDAKGPVVTLTEKIFVPIDKHPNFNFVGRILGPQGTTAKDTEYYTGCKIMVRGEGSMRDRKKEEQLKGKPNFEHLNEKLHVLIQCEDSHNRAAIRMEAAIHEIRRLLDPKPDGEDEIKRRQLMGLAVLNGTYRETNIKHPLVGPQDSQMAAQLLQYQEGQLLNQAAMASLLGPSTIRANPAAIPRLPLGAQGMIPGLQGHHNLLGVQTSSLFQDTSGLFYSTGFDPNNYAAAMAALNPTTSLQITAGADYQADPTLG